MKISPTELVGQRQFRPGTQGQRHQLSSRSGAGGIFRAATIATLCIAKAFGLTLPIAGWRCSGSLSGTRPGNRWPRPGMSAGLGGVRGWVTLKLSELSSVPSRSYAGFITWGMAFRGQR